MNFFYDAIMPDGMSYLVLLLLLAASFVSSFITVAFGIGGGAMLLAIMATLVPPAALIPTHGMIQIGSNLGRALVVLKHIFWPALPAFTIGSLIGAAVGGSLVVNIPPAWIQIAVGSFIIWSIFGRPPRGVRDWPLAVGLFSSFLTMFFGATGLFVATFTKSHELPRHSHVATHAALMTVQHGVKTIAFGLLGFAFGEWLPFIIAMMVLGFLGTLAGKLLLNRLDDRRFRFALDFVLVVLSVRLVLGGAWELYQGR
ncbi:sulfite exporter TauE/SafE family protein [Roseicyclus sp. F158]|uniref:Probable membrane transporter protein n=1 Tax=Tropicimonas omnivorans TaxID=3075590 RepID=A0ABU3DD23_9RHOB|nr:sulfite exporter TauE/SafE family protein [Roseicyclus sp. F158]MDT0681448.1 sulfite exporter TauE/SafE family protein [Roseicyclus sp. F158]